MKYKIHEAAKMLGLTPQTLRFYERYGISPGQRVGGGARQYSDVSVDLMMSMRKYRNCGFTVAETAELLTCKDPHLIENAMDRRTDALRREIEHQRRILSILEDTRARVSELELLHGELQPMLRPELVGRLFIPRGVERVARADMQPLSRWAAEMPLVRWVSAYDHTASSADERLPARGFVIGRDNAAFLGLDQEPELIAFPSCPCVDGMLYWDSTDHPQRLAVAEFCREVQRQGWEQNGNAMVCVLLNTTRGDGTFTTGQIWVPVRLPNENFRPPLDSHIP